MFRFTKTWHPAPRRAHLGQVNEPVTDDDVKRYRITNVTTGLISTGLLGASAWAGIYMGRKASGFASVVGWGIGILSGLAGTVELAVTGWTALASRNTIEEWILTDRAVAEAWAKSVMR